MPPALGGDQKEPDMTAKQYGQLTPKGQEWIEDQIRVREEGITRLMQDKGMDRINAMIVHDTEMSPRMTQGSVLRRLGYIPKCKTPVDADPDVVRERLWDIIHGLSFLHTYLTSTNHLTDRQLLDRLECHLLEEQIAFVPPTDDMDEYIDMNPGGKDANESTDRDRLLPRSSRSPVGNEVEYISN